MPPQLQSPSSPQRSHAHYYEGHHADESEDGWVPLGESWKTTGQPSFRLRSQNFRLSQAKRSGAKRQIRSKIDHPKGAPCAFAQSPLPDPSEIEDRYQNCDMRKVAEVMFSGLSADSEHRRFLARRSQVGLTQSCRVRVRVAAPISHQERSQ